MINKIANKVLQSSTVGDVVTKLGQPITTNGVSIDPTLESIPSHLITKIVFQQYETDEQHLIENAISAENNIIELGGGIGYLSCYINNLLQNPSNHIVIEANPNLVEVINRHRELNNCEYSVYHSAYSTTEQTVYFALQDSDRLLGSSCHRAAGEQITVPTVDLKTLSERMKFNDYCLVADIEGSEQELIRSELDELVENCSMLIVEYHWPLENISESDVIDTKELLTSNGFEQMQTAMDGRVVVYENTTRE